MSIGRLLLLMEAVALLLVGTLAALAAFRLVQDDAGPVSNGWIAFARSGTGTPGPNGWVTRGIYLVRQGERAHRILGSEGDSLDQVCPAFSRDGSRLAHGQARGTLDTTYHDAALVIADIDPDGAGSESRRIDVGGTFPPPCAVWSADDRWVAFGVPQVAPGGDHDRPGPGSEVWVANVDDGRVTRLADVAATDLEWSPDGSLLAIASLQTDPARGEPYRIGSIRLYDAETGDMRPLVPPSGVWSLTWSPDGRRIAYQRGQSDGGSRDQEIRVAQVDGSGDALLTERPFAAVFGEGPVWSPTGRHIVYLRMKPIAARHDVVLVDPDDGSEIMLPDLRSWRPDSVTWSPDGDQLLYVAWISGRPGRSLIARSLDPVSDDGVVLDDDVVPGARNRSWAAELR